jgi:NAD(P)-dependent dehydrogenase (short-subunit alcohol dehydrogenase family)
MTSLSDKVVWVTGAGRGLGREIALGMAARRATVVATSRSATELDALRAEADGTVRAVPGSVADPDFVASAASSIVEELGRLDVLVTMAGISPTVEPSEQVDDSHWEHVISVNLTGTFYCCREAGRHMLEAGTGSIITVSSVHGRHGIPRQLAYAASKGGVEQLTRTLGAEWAPRGVRVNCLAPGYFVTDLTAAYVKSHHGERTLKRIPLGRFGQTPEIVGAAVYLASDESSYLTGSVLTIDGGWSAA